MAQMTVRRCERCKMYFMPDVMVLIRGYAGTRIDRRVCFGCIEASRADDERVALMCALRGAEAAGGERIPGA